MCFVVYTQDLLDECRSTSSVDETSIHPSLCSSCWRSVVVVVPMRLGGEVVNPMYVPCLKALLNNEQCIGLIGGKPKHSLYFVGWQGNCLFVFMVYKFLTYCRKCTIYSEKKRPTCFPISSLNVFRS